MAVVEGASGGASKAQDFPSNKAVTGRRNGGKMLGFFARKDQKCWLITPFRRS